MGPPVRFARNRAGAGEIALHLTICSPLFTPPLADRVVISDYAQKLAAHAERFEGWSDHQLVALVALYCPAGSEAGEAFISNVSTLPAFGRRGVARSLLRRAITYATRRASRISLQVDRRASAFPFYLNHGFVVAGSDGDTLTLIYKTI